MKQALLTVSLTLTTNTATAGFTDGNEPYQLPLEDENQNDSRLAVSLFKGYVAEVVDLMNGLLFCATPGVTRGKFIAAAAKHIKSNPEKWNKSAESIVAEAMKEAFPCKKQYA